MREEINKLTLESTNNEIWKDVKGYEGMYQVSNLGNVRRLEQIIPTHNLKPMLVDTGHLRVNLYNQNGRYPVNINKLVAEAFLPNENNLHLVGHKDGNKQNNCVDNLYWTNDTKKSTKLEEDIRKFLSGDSYE